MRLKYPSPFLNVFAPLLRETSHFQLEACREPGPPQVHRLCDSAGFGCAFVCTRGLVQQCANTHVPLCEPSATRRPVWHSLCHPHVICGHEPFRPLQALLHLTFALTSHSRRAISQLPLLSNQGDIVLAPYVSSVIQCTPDSKSHVWKSNTSQSLGGFSCFITSGRSLSYRTSTIIHTVSSSDAQISQTVGRNGNIWRDEPEVMASLLLSAKDRIKK